MQSDPTFIIASEQIAPPQPPGTAIGLIGGMSWHSTVDYYSRLNLFAERSHGEHANPPSIIDTLAFGPLLSAAARGDWGLIEQRVIEAGIRLQRAGCVVVGLTAVTAHRAHAALADSLGIGVPHIFDAVAAELSRHGAGRIGVLATSRTLTDPATLDRLALGRALITPTAERQVALDRLIFERLTVGRIDTEGRAELDAAIAELAGAGADLVVLACTELPLLRRLPSTFNDKGPVIVDAVDAHVRALLERVSEIA